MAGHQDNDDTPKSGLLSHADITSRLMDLESQETDMTTEWKTVLALRAVEDVKMKKKRDQEDAIWKQRFDQMDRDEDELSRRKQEHDRVMLSHLQRTTPAGEVAAA